MSSTLDAPRNSAGLLGMLKRRSAASSGASFSPAELEAWIIAWLAPKMGVAPTSLDPQAAFTDYGLDSMVAVGLSGELEQLLGRAVSPSVAWEYPTIAELARHLADGRTDDAADMDVA